MYQRFAVHPRAKLTSKNRYKVRCGHHRPGEVTLQTRHLYDVTYIAAFGNDVTVDVPVGPIIHNATVPDTEVYVDDGVILRDDDSEETLESGTVSSDDVFHGKGVTWKSEVGSPGFTPNVVKVVGHRLHLYRIIGLEFHPFTLLRRTLKPDKINGLCPQM